MFDDDDNDIIISGNDNVEMYTNAPQPRRNASYKVSEVEMRVKGGAACGEGEGPKRYLSHLPSPRTSERGEGQYIDLINPYFSTRFSEYEGLPNLLHPQSSPFMVHRFPSHHPSLAPPRGPADRQPTRAPVERARSDKLQVPHMLVTRHFEPISGAGDSPKCSSAARDSPPRAFPGAGDSPPRVLPGASCDSPTTTTTTTTTTTRTTSSSAAGSPPDTPRPFFRSRVSAREVFTIGGTLSADDCSPGGTPRPRPRKSLMGAIHGRKKPSEPKLRSIRRVDSAGYEVPAALYPLRPKSAACNHYTALNRARTEEHVYDEIRHQTEERQCEGGAACLLELSVCGAAFLAVASAAPADGDTLSSPFVDGRASVRSEVGRYVEIVDSEHFAASPRGSLRTAGGLDDNQTNWGRKRSREEESLEMISEEQDGTPRKDAGTLDEQEQDGVPRKDTQSHSKADHRNTEDKTRVYDIHGDSHDVENPEMKLTMESDKNHVEYANNVGSDWESDEDDYQEVFDVDSTDDSWSDGDYTDAFANNNAAV